MEKPISWLAHKKINTDVVNDLLCYSVFTNQFTNGGPCVKLLEKTIISLLNVSPEKAVIVVNNGCSALHALVSALNMKEVKKLRFATQSYTFPVSAQGPLQESIIIDIDLDFGPDIKMLDIIKNSIDGVIITNVLGHVMDISKYEEWCRINSKYLILDNAATSSTDFLGKNSINYGIGSIISFHHTKPIGFGEGGAIIVNKEIEPFVRRVINFGYDMIKMNQIWHEEGSNYKMSDISAAYILQYLQNFESIKKKHQALYKYFLERMKEFRDKIIIFPNFSHDIPFVSCFPIFFKERIIENDDLKDMKLLGIETKKYYKPLILSGTALDYYRRNICFPCNVDMNQQDIEKIIQAIKILLVNQI